MPRRILCLILLLAAAFTSAAGALSLTTGDLGGTVRDGRGRGIPNVRVRILGGPQLGTARTDRNGDYRFLDLLPGVYELLVSKPGYVTANRSGVNVPANQAVDLDVALEWADPALGAVEVTVQGEGRLPLPVAEVDLLRDGVVFVTRSLTDEIGTVVFPGLPPGPYAVQARRPGYLEGVVRRVVVRAGALTGTTLRLRRDPRQAGRLGGVVRSQTGAGVPNALVRLVAGLTLRETRTGATGAYTLSNLIPGDGYALRVSAPGFATQTLGGLIVRQQQLTVQDVTLVPNAPTLGSLTGEVRDAAGQPVPFAVVSVTAGPGIGRQAIAGDDGRYLFTGLPPGTDYALIAEQDGFSPAGKTAVPVRAGETTVVNFELRNRTVPPGVLAGQVREAGSGVVLPDVIVELLNGPSEGLADTTDGLGQYRLEGVIPFEGYILRFRRNGYLPNTVPLLVVQPGVVTEANVQLTPLQLEVGQIQGTVRRSDNAPLSGVRVSIVAGPTSPLETTTDRDGRYSFRNLRAGTGYTLRAQRTGFVRSERRNLTLSSGQTFVVDFVLRRGEEVGAIRGQVIDLLGRGIPNAFVQVILGPQTGDNTRTDARGFFQFEALPVGFYTLEASANGYQNGRRGNIEVPGGGVATPLIQLLRP